MVMQLQEPTKSNTVVLYAKTDGNGFYQFSGMRPGLLDLRTTDPTGTTPFGGATRTGQTASARSERTDQPLDATHLDGIINIVVRKDQAGVNYNFGFVDDGGDAHLSASRNNDPGPTASEERVSDGGSFRAAAIQSTEWIFRCHSAKGQCYNQLPRRQS